MEIYVGGRVMAKGFDYSEFSYLCSNGFFKVRNGCPQYIDGWDSIMLAYVDYKERAEFVPPETMLRTWGTPERHWYWFKSALKVYRKEWACGIGTNILETSS